MFSESNISFTTGIDFFNKHPKEAYGGLTIRLPTLRVRPKYLKLLENAQY